VFDARAPEKLDSIAPAGYSESARGQVIIAAPVLSGAAFFSVFVRFVLTLGG
jgi:hypothetical protein